MVATPSDINRIRKGQTGTVFFIVIVSFSPQKHVCKKPFLPIHTVEHFFMAVSLLLKFCSCNVFPSKNLHIQKNIATFATQKPNRPKAYGVLAHLARARHWQCRGERFESAILHQRYRLQKISEACIVIYYYPLTLGYKQPNILIRDIGLLIDYCPADCD